MSFDNNHTNRKDHRKPYHGSAAIDRSCRPGGDCPWREGARKAKEKRQAAAFACAAGVECWECEECGWPHGDSEGR